MTVLTAGVALPEASDARRGDRLHRDRIDAAALAHRLQPAGVFVAG